MSANGTSTLLFKRRSSPGKWQVQFIVLAGLLGAAGLADLAQAQQLFWTDGNLFAIKSWPLAGGPISTIFSNQNFSYLGYDPLARQLYYSVADPVPKLCRSRPDGSREELLLTFDSHNYVRGLAIDAVNGKIYWSSSDGYVAGNGKIRRSNLDGTGLEDLVTGMAYPYGIALDVAGGKMFWIRQEDNSIWRANLDGSQAERLIPLGSSSYAFSLALDAANARLYWSDPGNQTIGRANLDGSDVKKIADLDMSSLDGGITVDGGPDAQWRSLGTRPNISGIIITNDSSQALFWADTINHKVYASSLDGAGAHEALSGEPNYAQHLQVVRYWETALSAARTAQGVELSWNSRTGIAYRVEAKTPGTTDWADISGRLNATGPRMTWTDANALSAPVRLYRVTKVN